MVTVSREKLAELFTWGIPPTPPVEEAQDDDNHRARWMKVFNAVDYQVHRMDRGHRACNDLITVKEIAKYSKESLDFTRQVMKILADFSRAIEECFERL